MEPHNKELQVLERLFRELIDNQNPKRLQSGINDLFVRINTESGEVMLFGDDDELLASTVIFAWVGQQSKTMAEMSKSLRSVVRSLDVEGYWDNELFEKPFSVLLVGDEFEVIEELLFLDDELVKVSLPLLENLDDELNSFINQLLSK